MGITKTAIATAIGGLVVAVILQYFGLLPRVFSWLWEGALWVWGMLVSSHPITGWAILVLVLLALSGLIIIGMAVIEILQAKNKPPFATYTEDMVDGVKWRWAWQGETIVNLRSFCPTCDSQLIYRLRPTGTLLICERCPADEFSVGVGVLGKVIEFMPGRDWENVLRAATWEIERRIRTNEWESADS